MHNYATKIRNHEKRWVQMQDTGDELTINRKQLKTILYICRPLYQNFRVIHTNKKKQLKYNTKIVIKPQEERTRVEGKKKEQQKQIQNN